MKLLATLQARWNEVSRREQRLLRVALVIVLLALLWWVGIAPALATLRAAEKQHQGVSGQMQEMQRLQTQAKTLQAQPRLAFAEAQRLLEASVKQQFGASAQLLVSGESVSLTLKGATPDALAQWLTQARLNARAVPSEAHLLRNAAGTWDGSLVLKIS